MDTRISELHIEGYRSLRDVTWRPGALNVVIGPNSTGKSNLLKALSLVGASARGRLQDVVNDDGGMGSILWNRVGMEVKFRLRLSDPGNGADAKKLQYDMTLLRLGDSASYRVSSEQLAEQSRASNGATGPARSVITVQLNGSTYDAGDQIVKLPPAEGPTAGETLLSRIIQPVQLTPEINACQSALRSWQIFDQLAFLPRSAARQAVTARYAEQLSPDASNLSSVLHTFYSSNSEFREEVDDAMFAAFGEEYKHLTFPPTGGQTQIQMAVQWKSINDPVTTTDLSDGTLRFLAIITALSQPNPPALIAIDEPETGLHPRMMRIVAGHARNAALRSQVVFTTHSTAFLDAFESSDPPTICVAELVDGRTSVRTLDSGELNRWLASYTLGDLYDSLQLDQMPAAEEAAE